MAKIIWFTQPQTDRNDLHFASFYMYDTDNRNLVRIRLELHRDHGSGKAKIMCKNNRIVLSGDHNENLEIIKNNRPKVYSRIYDFTIGHNSIHKGNCVTDMPYLPKGITVDNLTELANKYIGKYEDINLVSGNATEEQLVTAIKEKLQNP